VRYAGHMLQPLREKYIAKAFDPFITFHKYKAYKHTAIREFYSLLRAGMMRTRRAQAYQ
jgi:hypothetical protein